MVSSRALAGDAGMLASVFGIGFRGLLDALAFADILSGMGRVAADSSVFQAIADPTRRAVLDVLREGERSVGALMEALAKGPWDLVRTTQGAFSQHLAVLRGAGLVAVKKRGRERIYSIRAEGLEEVVEWVVAYERFWEERLEGLGRYLDAKHGRSGEKERGT